MYMSYIHRLVQRSGIGNPDWDDVADELLVKFIEKDILSWYDPEKIHTTVRADGSIFSSTAAFKTFLRRLVLLYVRHQRDRVSTRNGRELLCLDFTAAGSISPEDSVLAVPDPTEEIVERVGTQQAVGFYHDLLSTVHWTKGRMLSEVFDAMVAMHNTEQPITQLAVGALLGVCKDTAGKGIAQVRSELAAWV